jgi:hypothetical protein
LAETAGDETADRFLTNARSTFADLAEQPQIGARLNLSNPVLEHMRKWRVRGFEKYLVVCSTFSDRTACRSSASFMPRVIGGACLESRPTDEGSGLHLAR